MFRHGENALSVQFAMVDGGVEVADVVDDHAVADERYKTQGAYEIASPDPSYTKKRIENPFLSAYNLNFFPLYSDLIGFFVEFMEFCCSFL